MEKIMEMFFGLWLKFDIDRGVRMQLTPFEWEFVDYKGHKEWRLKRDFAFDRVSEVELRDTRFPHLQGLRAELYGYQGERLALVFFLADWREGGREGITPYLLYDSPVHRARPSDIWVEIKKTAVPWHEAHIRGDQEPLWDWIKEHYMALPRR